MYDYLRIRCCSRIQFAWGGPNEKKEKNIIETTNHKEHL